MVLLIDSDSLIYYEAYKEDTNDALNGIDIRVKRILEENNATKFVMFLTEGKCFRYAKATVSEYKGNRKDNINYSCWPTRCTINAFCACIRFSA